MNSSYSHLSSFIERWFTTPDALLRSQGVKHYSSEFSSFFSFSDFLFFFLKFMMTATGVIWTLGILITASNMFSLFFSGLLISLGSGFLFWALPPLRRLKIQQWNLQDRQIMVYAMIHKMKTTICQAHWPYPRLKQTVQPLLDWTDSIRDQRPMMLHLGQIHFPDVDLHDLLTQFPLQIYAQLYRLTNRFNLQQPSPQWDPKTLDSLDANLQSILLMQQEYLELESKLLSPFAHERMIRDWITSLQSQIQAQHQAFHELNPSILSSTEIDQRLQDRTSSMESNTSS